MSRIPCTLAAFVAFLALAGGDVAAQVGKKPVDEKKTPEGKKAEVKKDADARTKEGPSYLPLQVGNRWEYTLKIGEVTKPMIMRIARVESAKVGYLAFLEKVIDGKVVATEHLRQTDEGILQVRSNQVSPVPPIFLLKAPFKAGDNWDGTFAVGKNKIPYTVETDGEEIEVPAGTFRTLRASLSIEVNGKPSVTTSWYAEGVGIVKQSIDGNFVALLDKHTVKPVPGAGAVAGGPAAPRKLSNRYFPLDVGNRWEYDLNVNGNIVPVVSQIVRNETIEGMRYAVHELRLGDRLLTIEHLRQSDKGVFQDRVSGRKLNPPILLVKTPLKSGDKWSGSFQNISYTAETETETVEVPAGSFKAIRIVHTIADKVKNESSMVWVVENIGIVKQREQFDGMEYTFELSKFSLKKAVAAALETAEVDPAVGLTRPQPLEVGTRWEYGQLNGNEKMACRIVRIDEPKANPLYVFEWDEGGTKKLSRLQIQKEGIVSQNVKDISPSPMLILKLPLPISSTWKAQSLVEGQKVDYSAEAAADDLVIPFGSYKTVRVKIATTTNGKTETITRWYAQDIGIVQIQFQSPTGRNATFVLREFELGQESPK